MEVTVFIEFGDVRAAYWAVWASVVFEEEVEEEPWVEETLEFLDEVASEPFSPDRIVPLSVDFDQLELIDVGAEELLERGIIGESTRVSLERWRGHYRFVVMASDVAEGALV